ncbi:MAG: hypothetical protein ACTSVB_05625 [Candidatus Heimdallarchaeaceae archaeon]
MGKFNLNEIYNKVALYMEKYGTKATIKRNIASVDAFGEQSDVTESIVYSNVPIVYKKRRLPSMQDNNNTAYEVAYVNAIINLQDGNNLDISLQLGDIFEFNSERYELINFVKTELGFDILLKVI